MAKLVPKGNYNSQAKAMMNGIRWKKACYASLVLNIILIGWCVYGQ